MNLQQKHTTVAAPRSGDRECQAGGTEGAGRSRSVKPGDLRCCAVDVHTNVHTPGQSVATLCSCGSSRRQSRQSRPGRRSRGVRRVGRRALTARSDSGGHNGCGRPIRAGLDAPRLPFRCQPPRKDSGVVTGRLPDRRCKCVDRNFGPSSVSVECGDGLSRALRSRSPLLNDRRKRPTTCVRHQPVVRS
jgi:hypothetical protein